MTADSGLGAGVQSFLARYIQSVEQLEVLLLLVRTAPKEWASEAVAAELRVASSSAQERLQDLERRGLVVRGEAAHRYQPRAEQDAAVRQVADAYRERRVAVINCIFSSQTDTLPAPKGRT